MITIVELTRLARRRCTFHDQKMLQSLITNTENTHFTSTPKISETTVITHMFDQHTLTYKSLVDSKQNHLNQLKNLEIEAKHIKKRRLNSASNSA